MAKAQTEEKNLPATLDLGIDVGTLVQADESTIDAVSKASDFLPRLQVFGSSSNAVKEGNFPMGHMGLAVNKDTNIDLGTEVNVLVLSVRAKAVRGLNGEDIESYYDLKNPEFKKIQIEAQESDSGCMWGPEYLVWIPSLQKFATIHFGSKSARPESANLLALFKKDGQYRPCMATIQAKFIKSKKYSWHVASVLPCAAGLTVPPPPEQLKDEINKFNNPPASTTEKEEPSEAGDRVR